MTLQPRHRIKCKMPWPFGNRYVTPNGSDQRQLWVTAKSDELSVLKDYFIDSLLE